jgi:flagellar motor switch protein FliN/FliY
MPKENTGSVALLHALPVEMVVELGRAQLTVRDLAHLDRDAVIELDRHTNQPVDILVGGRLFARGEVEIVDDRVALRVTELLNTPQAETA